MIVEQGKNEFIEEVKEIINNAINILVRDAEVDERNLDAYEISCLEQYIEILKITQSFEKGDRKSTR